MKFEDMINTIQLGDCYELIKDIPDKSIDLVYIDPPYEYTTGGCGKNQTGKYKQLCERKYKNRATLEGKIYGHGANKDIVKIANEIRNISDGFDFNILDELERIMKKTNIYIWCSRKKEKYLHPTIKPLKIVKNHIINSTKENDIVLDCFCGSGTTCLACKETGRRYIGMEIDPEYHKIAVNRLNGITANGQTSIFTDFSKL